jgi:nickel transport system permease protein
MRYILHRMAVGGLRWCGAVVVVLVIVEWSYAGLAGAPHHIWSPEAYSPEYFGKTPPGAAQDTVAVTLGERLQASTLVVVMAAGSSLLVAGSWGILAARWRRWRLRTVFRAGFGLMAAIPGIWLVSLGIAYSYVFWQRPGFADEFRVSSGPDLLKWGQATLLTIAMVFPAIAWQIQAVARVLEAEGVRACVRGWDAAGWEEETLFYRKVLRRAKPQLIALADATLPFLLGSLVPLEWLFHYQGMGQWLVQSVHNRNYPGTICSLLWMVSILTLAGMVKEFWQGRAAKS